MMSKHTTFSAAQARGILLILLSAVLVLCASLAAVFLVRTRRAGAEEREEDPALNTHHADGDGSGDGDGDDDEDFFDVLAEYEEQTAADVADDSDEGDHEHDEVEPWELHKVSDESDAAQAYTLRVREVIGGSSAKEDGVKRR